MFSVCPQKSEYEKTLDFFEKKLDQTALFDYTMFRRIEGKTSTGKSIFDSVQVGYILWQFSKITKDKKLKQKSKNLAEKIFSSVWKNKNKKGEYLWGYESLIGPEEIKAMEIPDIDTTSVVLAIFKITNFKNIPKEFVESLTQFIREDGTVKIWIAGGSPFTESGDLGIAANVLWAFSVYDIYNERVERICKFIHNFVSNPQNFKDIWYRTYYLSDYLALYNIVRALPYIKCQNKNEIKDKIEKTLTYALIYDKDLNITTRCAIISSLLKLNAKLDRTEIEKISEHMNKVIEMKEPEYIYAGDPERKYLLGVKALSCALCLEALFLSNQ
ncbi:MAG: hypothetical protein RRA63_03610 [Candidatus Calescibacterium sp.]|nr:hypothetical protein [Candidatus Calescibacterium sp.]